MLQLEQLKKWQKRRSAGHARKDAIVLAGSAGLFYANGELEESSEMFGALGQLASI